MSGFEKKGKQCGDINECKDSPCLNGLCINLPGKYRCMCRVNTYLAMMHVGVTACKYRDPSFYYITSSQFVAL